MTGVPICSICGEECDVGTLLCIKLRAPKDYVSPVSQDDNYMCAECWERLRPWAECVLKARKDREPR